MQPPDHSCPNRREMLLRCGAGLGSLGLAALLRDVALADGPPAAAAPASISLSPASLAVRAPQFAPRAKRLVHIFANGGASQIDTFDPKPLLGKYNGQRLPKEMIPAARNAQNNSSPVLASPFKFSRCGQSGTEVSELFPHIAKVIDDICVVRSMHADDISHDGGILFMNTGAARLSRPSLGSWVTYGLGSENNNLPGFIALCPDGYPLNEMQNWQSAFLPSVFQGTYVNSKFEEVDKLIENIRNTRSSTEQQRQQLDLLGKLNRAHQAGRGDDERLESRIQSFEQAFRMQTEASDAFDLSGETKTTVESYGQGVQARQLMIARRLLERGVRVVQVWYGPGFPWDHHGEIVDRLPKMCADVDRPIAAFLTDLKQRGLLDDTLVLWGGEFGRTPTAELPAPTTTPGRDHNRHGFTVWLAGGGIKRGHVHGATDDAGFAAIHDKVHVHDLHATLLHLLGLDHERLTYRYAGRDFRLTDVHGQVLHDIIA